MLPALVLLHGFTQTRQSWRRTAQALAGRYRALVPDLPGHGQAVHRTASFDACAAYVRALAPAPPVHARGLLDGRPDRAPHRAHARARRSSRGSCSWAPARASPIRRSARARRAADDALADRIETLEIEAFAREWGAQPLFADQPRARRRGRARRPPAQHARGPRGRAARAGDGRDGAALGAAAGARDPGHARRRRARREVPRARRGDAGAATERAAGDRARRRARGPARDSRKPWPRPSTSRGRPLRRPPRSRRRRSPLRGGRRTRRVAHDRVGAVLVAVFGVLDEVRFREVEALALALAGFDEWCERGIDLVVRRLRPFRCHGRNPTSCEPGSRKARRSIRRAAPVPRSGSAKFASVASPHGARDPQRGGGVDAGGDPERAVERRRRGRRSSRPRAPRGRPRARPEMPPREIFRHTSSAAPEPGAWVSSIAIRTGDSAATARSASTPWTGSSHSSRPTGASARRFASASSGVSQAPLASTRISTSGPTAARTAASRPASSPIPTLTFTQRKPSRTAAAAAVGRAGAVVGADRGVDRHLVGGAAGGSASPAACCVRREAWSQSARSIAASACGRSRSARQAASTSAVGSIPASTSA